MCLCVRACVLVVGALVGRSSSSSLVQKPTRPFLVVGHGGEEVTTLGRDGLRRDTARCVASRLPRGQGPGPFRSRQSLHRYVPGRSTSAVYLVHCTSFLPPPGEPHGEDGRGSVEKREGEREPDMFFGHFSSRIRHARLHDNSSSRCLASKGLSSLGVCAGSISGRPHLCHVPPYLEGLGSLFLFWHLPQSGSLW